MLLAGHPQHGIHLSCPQDGWNLLDGSCVKLLKDHKQGWKGAQTFCQSVGAHLVRLDDHEVTQMAGQLAKKDAVSSFWIGFSTNSQNQSTWEDNSVSSVSVGFWSDGFPYPSEDKCVYVTNSSGLYLWSDGPCDLLMSYMCQRSACSQSSFHCSRDACVNQKWVCDGVDDCGDFSDELGCSSRCSYHQKGSVGTITPSDQSQDICYWLIEGPIGSNIQLNITSVSGDFSLGDLLIFDGGLTEASSSLLSRVRPGSTPLVLWTASNLILIKYNRGSQNSIVTAEWMASSVEVGKSGPFLQNLMAGSAASDVSVDEMGVALGDQDFVWVMTAAAPRQLVTLVFEDLHLIDGDLVEVLDGDVMEAQVLAHYPPSLAQAQVIISTGQNVLVHLRTGKYSPSRKFQFSYKQGCDVMLTASSGIIASPGHFVRDYPAFQKCTYKINTQTEVVLFVDNEDLQDGDVLKVFTGLDNSGVPGYISGQGHDHTIGLPGHQLYLEFSTNYINNSKGFKASYSLGCERPDFNPHTSSTPNMSVPHYKARLTITCDQGYNFRDEMYQPQVTGITYVEMECLFGGNWNVKVIPQCEPVYCGFPPLVDNGYVEASTGVVYGETVTYNCFDGYTVSAPKTVTCQSDGSWTAPPTCTASNCPAFERPLNSDITVNGDGSHYSTIVDYTCNGGYQIIGATRIFCTSDNTWSHPFPNCTRVQCQVPDKIMNGEISGPEEAFFGDVINLRCDSGYRLSGLAALTCLADQQFGDLPECMDVDECAQDELNNCTGVAVCRNEPGTYKCTCPSGYTLNNDSLSCSDIDECSGQHYCTQARCVNEDGSYSCECFVGYQLFNSSHMEGYTIPVSENGYRAGDVYYINHTCVRVLCPIPPVPLNTQPLTVQSQYGYGDWIKYMCKLGYVLSSGMTSRQCKADGTWSMDAPVCSVAMCPAEVIPDTVQNRPEVTPEEAVNYLNSSTLTCHIPGMDAPVIKHRTCLYDQEMNTYRFFGAPFECGYIDCGEPEMISGAKDYRPQLNNNTVYGQSFQVECLPLFRLEGESSLDNTTVTCLKSGVWGFNTLRCVGETCSDPGRPPDAVQMASGYEEGKTVSYTCTREGFALNDTTPLRCVQDPSENTLHWDLPVPVCRDVEKPQFDSCPDYIEIDPFEAPGFDVPLANDNSGLVSMFSVQPEGFSPEYKLADSVNVTYMASDGTGNTAYCQISVHVRDFQRPDITCPDTHEEVYPHMTVNLPLGADLVQASGVEVQVTFTPPQITSTDIGKHITVQAQATDKYNRKQSCSFQVHVNASVCAERQIAIPVNGIRECKPLSSVSSTSLSCSLTCQPGYTFYEDGLKGHFEINCTDNTGQPKWTNSEVPNCVSTSERAQLEDLFQYVYQPEQPVTQDCIDQYRHELVTLYGGATDDLSKECLQLLKVPIIVGIPSDSIRLSALANGSKIVVDLTIQYSPVNETSERIKGCSQLVDLSVKVNPDYAYLKSVTMSMNCSALTGRSVGQLSYNYTCPQHQKLREHAGFWWCLNCPAGSFISTGGCEACEIGTYQEEEGQRSCVMCPDAFSTYTEGSSSHSHCTALCPMGWYSATGLPPCTECPRNTFWENSTSCTQCPVGKKTLTTGSHNATQCIAACPAGTYSGKQGLLPCMDCPRGFYQDQGGQTTCKACPDGYTTNYTAAVTQQDCFNDTELCSAVVCHNGGECLVQNHHPYCRCSQGYTGNMCENIINQCDSQPCYYGNNCTSFLNGYSCSCRKPVNSCPDVSVTIQRYRVPDLAGSVAKLIQPRGLQLDKPLLHNTTLIYTPRDEGLNNQCHLPITVTDLNPIMLECPQSRSEFISEMMERRTVDVSVWMIKPPGADVTVNPEKLNISYSDIGTAQEVFVTATRNGLTVRCSFQVFVQVATSSALILQNLLINSDVDSCRESPGHPTSCSVECDPGYSIHGAIGVFSAPVTLTEEDGLIPPDVPKCVKPVPVSNNTTPIKVLYETENEEDLSARCMQSLQTAFSACKVNVPDVLEEIQDVKNSCGTVNVNININPGLLWVHLGNQASVEIQVRYSVSATDLDLCKAAVQRNLNKTLESECGTLNLTAREAGCPYAHLISIQSADNCPPGYKQEEELCIPCPPGTYYVGRDCFPCPLHEYNDKEAQSTCKPCPPVNMSKGTRQTGSTVSSLCTDFCSGPYTSVTGLPPCDECPKGYYAVNRTTCEKCPDGTSTADPGAQARDQCVEMCPKGSVSFNGLIPCYECPPNYFQSDIGKSTCEECPENTTTTMYGSTSVDDCKDAALVYCNQSVCANGGRCVSRGNGYMCRCPEGYFGDNCQLEELFYGDNCEFERNDCGRQERCVNGGMCQDLPGNFTCLCPAGFSGRRCELQIPVCEQFPCVNNGACQDLGGVRRACSCPSGYTGKDCELNIDDCASAPCLNGGDCIDALNNYTCECRSGFQGRHCTERIDLCLGQNCNNSGQCIDDHVNNTHVCICEDGYQPTDADFTGCSAVDGCSSNPCTGVGSRKCTMSGPGTYDCVCKEGYGGSLCQHNMDDCGSCQNGASCVDLVADYRCHCADGFEGKNCNVNIDDCARDVCDMEGSFNCTDLINDYMCNCKPGYSGKNCSVEVNECESFPCKHGGGCTDLVNDFLCDCVPGWQGKQCDEPANRCLQDSPCQNKGECISIFDTYFCRCSGNKTFGGQCEFAPGGCTSVQPCLNGGLCSDENDTVVCSCPRQGVVYTGDGCESRANLFLDGGCQNGGSPMVSPSGNLTCACLPGYSGTVCDVNVDDCLHKSCPGGRCVDAENIAFCRCPVGWTGDSCTEAIDVDYDLHFYSSMKTGQASLPYPIALDLASFTFSFWVRFQEADSTGTFFMAFQVPTESSLRMNCMGKLVQVSSDGLKVYFPGVPTPGHQSIDYSGVVRVNDGRWHHLTIDSWYSQGAYNVRFTTDGSTVGTRTFASAVTPADTFIWVTLGSEYDPCLEKPVSGQGFKGYISQVNLYNRVLDFDTETPVLAENTTAVLPGVVLRWAEFTLSPGVNRVQGSSATPKDEMCPEGFTGLTCSVRTYSERRMPQKPVCPMDVELYSEDRVTQVHWDPPTTTADIHLRSSASTGESFLWGRHLVIYEAKDDENSTAMCSFIVYVKNDVCNMTLGPDKGSFTKVMYRSYTNFELMCSSSNLKLTRPTPDFYTCGPSGNLDPRIPQKYIPYRFPSCGEVKSSAGVKLVITLKYTTSLNCDEQAKQIMISRVMGRLKTLNQDYGSEICQTADCSDVRVSVNCMTTSGRRKRATSELLINTEIPYIKSLVENNGKYVSPGAVIQKDIVDGGWSFPGALTGLMLDENTYDVDIIPQCPEGEGLVEGVCVLCGRGYEHNILTQTCEPCPVGEYKDDGQPACVSCGAGQTTMTPGSPSQDDCKESCGLGHYNNYTDCVPCEVGFYQPDPGQFTCLPCGVARTTLKEGSKAEQDCFNKCDAGFELVQTGDCVPCKIGFYRPQDADSNCVRCPPGWATPTNQSTAETDCTVVDCAAGFHINGTSCVECPQGTYQPMPYQDSCLSCPGDNSTRRMASKSLSDCESYCPPGQEKQPDSSCRSCVVGFYKDNSEDLFAECTLCDEEFITAGMGADSASSCSVRNCSMGTFRNMSNECEQCGVGYYQPDKWQESCILCPEDNITAKETSTSITDCSISSCHPGKQDINGTCTLCEVGYYKSGFGAGPCLQCSGTYTTLGKGAKSQSDCNLVACNPGHFNNSNRCSPCDYGQYQPDRWQDDCLPCDAGTVTLLKGAIMKSQCVADCGKGTEYNTTLQICTQCERGWYRDKASLSQVQCVSCPEGWVTSTPGATRMEDCDTRNCSAGSFYNSTSTECEKCPKGQYQPEIWSSSCEMCPGQTTTIQEGADKTSDCLAVCSPGQGGEGGVCQPCPRGTYKEGELAGVCSPCPPGTTTAAEGTDLEDKCNQTACDPGWYRDSQQNTCVQCGYGQYQPEKWQDTCVSCPQGKTTLSEGNTQEKSCVADCVEGSEYNTISNVCVECKRGYYRDKSSPSQTACVICPNGLITLRPGTADMNDCNVANCTEPGTYRNSNKNECEACPKGLYQDTKWQDSCKKCDDGLTTREEGSKQQSDCIVYCPSGQELVGSRCVVCARGFYKSNAEGVFGRCKPCDPDMITPATGATAPSQCIQRNCSAGYMRTAPQGPEICEPCPIGTYQPDKWQTECLACPGGKSTADTGAMSVQQCYVVCEAGETVSSGSCSLCPRGYYSSGGVASICGPCPQNKTTLGVGSRQPEDCSQTACSPGQYRTTANTCNLCPLGMYQPEKWQDQCLTCPQTQTTIKEGAKSANECVEKCPAGNKYEESSRTCMPCERGTYREDGTPQAECVRCPVQFITQTTGSKSSNDCDIADCSRLGTFRNAMKNTCEPCPVGTYQDTKWQDRCVTCADGSTTNGTGATKCIDICDVPNYCQNSGTCHRGTTPYCACTAAYTGDRCQTRRDAETLGQNQQATIVGSVIGVIMFLILVAMIIMGICVLTRRKKRQRRRLRRAESSIMGAPRLVTDPYLYYGNSSLAGSIDTNRSFLKLSGPEEDVGYEFHGFQNPAVDDQVPMESETRPCEQVTMPQQVSKL